MEIKILVGCPTSEHKEYCLKEYIEAIKNLSYKNYNILLVDNSKDDRYYNKIKSLGINVIKDKYLERARDRIVHSRNIIREYVLDNGYDYFLSLEQDVIPPKDIIERLLRHDKDIVSGVYFKEFITKSGLKNILPLLYNSKEGYEYLFQLNEDDISGNKLIKVRGCGLGCVLIKRKVLDVIKFRYDDKNKAFDDMWFSYDANKKGFFIYSDTGVRCKHLIREMNWNKIKK